MKTNCKLELDNVAINHAKRVEAVRKGKEIIKEFSKAIEEQQASVSAYDELIVLNGGENPNKRAIGTATLCKGRQLQKIAQYEEMIATTRGLIIRAEAFLAGGIKDV